MTPLRILRRAQQEFDRGADWYLEQQPENDLSERFTEAINSILLEISANPFRWPKIRKNTREALVMGWPYAIDYIVRPNLIGITSIFNTHRDPKEWMGRK